MGLLNDALHLVGEATIYLEENHITTLEQLEEKLNALRDQVSDLSDSMNEKSARMKKLKEALRQAPVYQEKLPVYREMGTRSIDLKRLWTSIKKHTKVISSSFTVRAAF